MDILKYIGNTPLIEIKRLNPKRGRVKIFAKLEGSNPGGSIKDRPALTMLQVAERSGILKKNHTILEATSGNTGIAMAMIGAAKGYKVKLVMPANVSQERRLILQALGADVELTSANLGTDGAIQRVIEERETNPHIYFIPDQFKNKSNVLAHFHTTGPEIFRQTKGDVDAVVAGMGTTGTLMGVSQFFKKKKKRVSIIGIEPQKGHRIQGLKNMEESIVPEIFNPDALDKKLNVTDEEAFAYTRMLAIQEGIFAGMSSGAALAGTLKAIDVLDVKTIVVIFPDRGDRYLSTNVFSQTQWI